jgi:beta-mannosidase
VEDDSTRMSVHLTSDSTLPWDGLVRWRLESVSGELLASDALPIHVAPLADTLVAALDFADQINDDNCRNTIFVCELWQGRERLATDVSTFAPSKHLALNDPSLQAATSLVDGLLTFEISATSLARFVELELAGTDVIFSDNYFDLPAAQSVKISTPLPEGWSLEQARQALKVRSLYNSFA